jgi:hypothetical protein
MTIRELRILPPLAIGRLGSAHEPVDNYTIEDDRQHPLNFRRIAPRPTLRVNESTGEVEAEEPEEVRFKSGARIRPVAPFLEVFAIVGHHGGKDTIEPLTVKLLQEHKLGVKDIAWRVQVANRKVVRRTGNLDNLVAADTGWIVDHKSHTLKGHSKNFISPDKFIDFGHVRFIRPNEKFPEIRLRFTPAKGHIYGPNKGPGEKADPAIPEERAIYDRTKDWVGFGKGEVKNETLPPALYAIEPPAPMWFNDNIAISRGYLDDACDGFVEVKLTLSSNEILTATGRIFASPPVLVPDSLFVRNLADDLEQVLFGPDVHADEPFEVTAERAADIVRRAFETVRFLNVRMMNGNPFNGRNPLALDTMPEEESADTERAIRPVMSPGTVDTGAILALHEQVYAALRGGSAPWFARLLRMPDEVADYTDHGRRKMPAMMCGADNSYLALTWRQIETIRRAAERTMFHTAKEYKAAEPEMLTPLNLSAQLHHEAAGNPVSSRPVTSIANCCPGLEMDFRAVWRRMFEGVVLREYDSLVTDIDPGVTDSQILSLQGQRLLRVRFPEDPDHPGYKMMTPMYGPATSDTQGKIRLTTNLNPNGLAPLEWSNALAHILASHQGKAVLCDFTTDLTEETSEILEPVIENPKNYVTVTMQVRKFFEDGTAVISRALAESGELTQGLCSPWQNDYRECSCYYWASARPDFVNTEPAGNGLTTGDNWLQKVRTGDYVPDDYQDSRLILYDDLFLDWERWLRFQIGGRDSLDGVAPKPAAQKETA